MMSSVNDKKMCFDRDRAARMAAWVNLLYFAEIFWLQLHLSAVLSLIPVLIVTLLLMSLLAAMSMLMHTRHRGGLILQLFWADVHLALGVPWLLIRLWHAPQLGPALLAFAALRAVLTLYEIMIIVVFSEQKKAGLVHGQG